MKKALNVFLKTILALSACLALYIAGAGFYGAAGYYFSQERQDAIAFNRAQMIRTGELTE